MTERENLVIIGTNIIKLTIQVNQKNKQMRTSHIQYTDN